MIIFPEIFNFQHLESLKNTLLNFRVPFYYNIYKGFVQTTTRFPNISIFYYMPPEFFKLSSGYSMPALSCGTYEANESTRPAVENAVLFAINTGYRSIDTAWKYDTEKPVGNAIRKSGILRREMFVTTKVYLMLNSKRLNVDGIICTETCRRV